LLDAALECWAAGPRCRAQKTHRYNSHIRQHAAAAHDTIAWLSVLSAEPPKLHDTLGFSTAQKICCRSASWRACSITSPEHSAFQSCSALDDSRVNVSGRLHINMSCICARLRRSAHQLQQHRVVKESVDGHILAHALQQPRDEGSVPVQYCCIHSVNCAQIISHAPMLATL
jgi:hypothetical protein